MNKRVSRSVQWVSGQMMPDLAARIARETFAAIVRNLQKEASMSTTTQQNPSAQYQTIKQFVAESGRGTKVVTSVSARNLAGRVFFRVATQREHVLRDGTVRRSAWLGLREIQLKNALEKQAMEFIASESVRLKGAGASATDLIFSA